MLTLAMLCWLAVTSGFSATPTSRLSGVKLPLVRDPSTLVDLSEALTTTAGPTLLVLGTYPADFNQIEYAQKLRHYLPAFEEKGVGRTLMVVNGSPEACSALASELDLPAAIELLSDPAGEAGRRFGVSRGWLPDNEDLSPYLKLLGMLVGLGAGGTLPSVVAGYIGNPWGSNGWIQTALAQARVTLRRAPHMTRASPQPTRKPFRCPYRSLCTTRLAAPAPVLPANLSPAAPPTLRDRRLAGGRRPHSTLMLKVPSHGTRLMSSRL